MRLTRQLNAPLVSCFPIVHGGIEMKYKSVISKLALATLWIGCPPAAHALAYDVTFLGSYSSGASAINNRNQIIGYSVDNADSLGQPAMWQDGVQTNLGTLNGYRSGAYAINNIGQIAGYADTGQSFSLSDHRPIVWSDGVPMNIGAQSFYGPDVWGVATSINDHGQVVIYSIDKTTVWDGQETRVLSGSSIYYANGKAINNSGVVVGEVSGVGEAVPPQSRAAMWNGTIATVLPLLTPELTYANSAATAINDAGLVAGQSDIYIPGLGTFKHATLWKDGQAIDLGALIGLYGSKSNSSFAYGINEAGFVVGASDTIYGEDQHAMLWANGAMTDLNSLLDQQAAGAGWLLTSAYDINDNGWIVGQAKNMQTGQYRAFALTPSIPEPSVSAMFLLGLVGMMGAVGRSKGKL
jgi:probable HAF family extracellular repeat protein